MIPVHTKATREDKLRDISVLNAMDMRTVFITFPFEE
jgi:hypothetical protein